MIPYHRYARAEISGYPIYRSPLQDERRIRILVAHPWMGFGGSEATATWTVHALQENYDVTFATASPVDWNQINKVYGTSVDPELISTIRTARLPGTTNGTRLAHLQQAVFERACANLAQDFDLCISTYNFLNFRRTAIQLVADYSFSEEMRKRLSCSDEVNVLHRNTIGRRSYLALGEFIRNSDNIGGAHFTQDDRILSNSHWMARQLREQLAIVSDVIFPPVVLPECSIDLRSIRIPNSFAILGRIDPEKRVDQAIEILDMVRRHGFPEITLKIAGAPGGDPNYNSRVFSLIDEHNEWVTYVGFLDAKHRDNLLQSTSFGIHTRINEAFGIAVAEMAGFGCLPFVPNDSGPAEIINDSRLMFDSTQEAALKIEQVLSCSADEIEALRKYTQGQVRVFSADRFVTHLRKHVETTIQYRERLPIGLEGIHPVN